MKQLFLSTHFYKSVFNILLRIPPAYANTKVIRYAFSVFLILSALEHRSFSQPQFTGIGDLPGGEHHSRALAISDDGDVVVGMSVGTNSKGEEVNKAIKWNNGKIEKLDSHDDHTCAVGYDSPTGISWGYRGNVGSPL